MNSPVWSHSPASARCIAARSCGCGAHTTRRWRSSPKRSNGTSGGHRPGRRTCTGRTRRRAAHPWRVRFDAEAAYTEALGYGHEPQPGLALLWLAQGRVGAAVAAIKRLLAEPRDAVHRSQLLPGAVEILLAADETDLADRHECRIVRDRRRFRLHGVTCHGQPCCRSRRADARRSRRLPSRNCAARVDSGTSSAHRTRPPAVVYCSAGRCALSATKTRQSPSWPQRIAPSPHSRPGPRSGKPRPFCIRAHPAD